MIQFDNDGVTLFYIDANGKKIFHNYMEGEAYADMLTIRGAQQQAAIENTRAVANYNTALATTQASVTAGRADQAPPAPPKPLQRVVSNTGVVSYVPFDPPLADLVVLPAPVPPKPTGTAMEVLFGAAVAVAPGQDKQAIMYNMIQAMFRKMFPDV